MKPSLTDALCTRCGLCCDGSLFAEVELARADEASALEAMGLDIEDAEADDRELLLQPCGALKGKRCSIYPYRPDCCRTFECRLLQEVRRGAVGLATAQARIADMLKRIARLKERVVELGQSNAQLSLKERCADALELSDHLAADRQGHRKRAELEIAMTSMEGLMQETFLGSGPPRCSSGSRSALRPGPD